MKRQSVGIILIAVITLITLVGLLGCEPKPESDPGNQGVGPDLLSEDETVVLVQRETSLVEVSGVGLQTCGPIYRFVRGRTGDDREMVVWAGNEVVGHVYLDEVTTEDQAIFQTKELWRGCTVHDAIPVYIPDWARSNALSDIKEAPVNAFWQVIYSYGEEACKDSHFVPMLDLETALGGAIPASADVGWLHTLYVVEASPDFFDLVVRGKMGTILDRCSLNEHFGGQELSFDSPVDLRVAGYSRFLPNTRDLAIGFPAGDGSGEYRYVIFTFGLNGRMSTIPAGGYKEDGFIYTASAGHSIDFTTERGEDLRTLLAGVADGSGAFVPAKYVCDGTSYRFQKDDPFLVQLWNGEEIQREPVIVEAQGWTYSVSIEQTEYRKPPSYGDPGYGQFTAGYRGRFDVVVRRDDGKETGRLCLNELLEKEELGNGEVFVLIPQDYNGDGDPDFAIETGDPGSLEWRNALFSVNSEGALRRLWATGYRKDGFVYTREWNTGFDLLEGDEKGICVWVEDGSLAKCVWDGEKFVFSK